MDTQALNNALAQLRKAGAKDLPSQTTVLAAKNGTTWESKKHRSYDTWVHTKNSDTSYNVIC